MMVDKEEVLKAHKRHNGKIEVIGNVAIDTKEDLATYYTPGVAEVCLEIKNNKERVYDYTLKGRTVAIVTDGTRILGLGKIGPEAGLPVMEGKALLLKKFGGVDAFPICLNNTNEEKIVEIIKSIEPSFGLINIEDIETPKCITITEMLKEELSIPVFHDDRNGVGVVTLAALLNALKLAGKKLNEVKIVLNGAGAAGIGIAELLVYAGAKNIYVLDTVGLIYKGRTENMNYMKEELANITNKEKFKGDLKSAAFGADVLIGTSVKGAFNSELIKNMADKQIVFALSNPDPEIEYKEALDAGAFIVATGRSDMPNQVNNLSAFPGIIRGLLEVRAKSIDNYMLLRASKAIAKFVGKKLSRDYIMPDPSDERTISKLAAVVAGEIADASVKQNLARVNVSGSDVRKRVIDSLKRYKKIERLSERL